MPRLRKNHEAWEKCSSGLLGMGNWVAVLTEVRVLARCQGQNLYQSGTKTLRGKLGPLGKLASSGHRTIKANQSSVRLAQVSLLCVILFFSPSFNVLTFSPKTMEDGLRGPGKLHWSTWLSVNSYMRSLFISGNRKSNLNCWSRTRTYCLYNWKVPGFGLASGTAVLMEPDDIINIWALCHTKFFWCFGVLTVIT